MRMRLNNVSSGAFASTLFPSSSCTVYLPATAPAHPGGVAPTAYDSKVSFHGSGGTTRARAVPETDPTAALISPACGPVPAGVNLPSVTDPCKPSRLHVAL